MAPRLPRLIVPHCPHHVVQRGHSRQAVFASDDDYDAYLSDIYEKKMELGVQVHAYCLMTNHVHLLLTPGDDASGVARLMKEVARRATRRFNGRSARSGSLWESRYKSSLVQTETYLLACMRYIELNPVRAGMVARCEDYQWSSYRARMGSCGSRELDMHSVYLGLAHSESERRKAYRDYVQSVESADELALMRRASREGHPTADAEYSAALELSLGRQIVPKARGRPRKT
ncbi:transposase [Achromobacter sp. UMC71]|uniref:transposase n=1 Tax=Achromobacter sp. UMC71 TaxID=1862320 RepID=UPI0016028D35